MDVGGPARSLTVRVREWRTPSPPGQWVQCSLGDRWACRGPERGGCLQGLSPSSEPSPSRPPPPPVLRCLGIPTRVVTNYNSAHDQNSNLLIEYFRNEFGEIQKDKSEMIW